MILCTRARVIEWEISACMCTVMRLCRIFAAGRPRRAIVTHVFDFPLVSIVLRRHIQDPFSTFSFNRIKERAYFNVKKKRSRICEQQRREHRKVVAIATETPRDFLDFNGFSVGVRAAQRAAKHAYVGQITGSSCGIARVAIALSRSNVRV